MGESAPARSEARTTDPNRCESPRGSTAAIAAIAATELVCLGSLLVPALVGLPLRITSIGTTLEPETALSVVTALGAATGLVCNPLFGAWSDRTRHRGPGRAGFVLGGALVGVTGLALMLLAHNLVAVALAWMLSHLGFSATFAALYGLLADLVDEPRQALVSGWFGAAAMGSIVVGLGLVAVLPRTLGVVLLTMPALTLPVVGVAFWHLVRLPRQPAPPLLDRRPRAVLDALHGSPQYLLIWLQRFLVQLAYGIATAYGVFFLVRRAHLTANEAVTWVAASSAGAAALSILASLLVGSRAARHGSYGRYLAASAGLLGAALVAMTLGADLTAYVVASVLAGIGIGCYYAVDLALVMRTIPGQRAGLLLGLFNIARTLPQSLVPLAAPALLAVGGGDLIGDGPQNYAALYAAGLLVVLASLVPLRWITTSRRHPKPAGG
jgi:MFS family permease